VDCRHAVDGCVGSVFDGTVASDGNGALDPTLSVVTRLPLDASVLLAVSGGMRHDTKMKRGYGGEFS
jgi:hypothetical protein